MAIAKYARRAADAGGVAGRIVGAGGGAHLTQAMAGGRIGIGLRAGRVGEALAVAGGVIGVALDSHVGRAVLERGQPAQLKGTGAINAT